MRRYLPFVIVGLVAVVTVTGATMLYQAKKPVALTLPGNRADASGSDLHTHGSEKAEVTVEEFGDFECPPCGILSGPLNEMERDFKPHVRLVYRNFPLPLHKHATEAALVAEAAGKQGRFWEMHDLLFKEQAVWSKAPDASALFQSYAGILGLNLDQFKKDMADPEVRERVSRDKEEGEKLGVKNTPTVFLDGKEVPPSSLNPPVLRSTVEEAVKAKTKK